ncbi:NDR1/HIN1-like protein 10, partial [Durio zibethinus]|uniref:NDR1/HIN1-like protein 10 n=1 Tax=Durio zibethinus TaxID=66656 RepID=A0A6P6AMN2_DURZI
RSLSCHPNSPRSNKVPQPTLWLSCGCDSRPSKILLKITSTAVVGTGLGVLIFWLIFRPHWIDVHVTGVSLTEFNFIKNNTLNYNLVVNMTVHNPDGRVGIYYDLINASAYYEDQQFDTRTLTRFYQGHKNTSSLNLVFRGQHVSLGAEEPSKFNKEPTNGLYSIDVKLYLRIRLKLGRTKTSTLKPKISCDLKVPLSSGDGSFAGAFEITECDWDI